MLAVVAALAPSAGAQATDAVRVALERGDVFAGSGQLGPRAVAARRELATVAAELRADDRPVKLAVVPGRGDSRALLAYARRLRRDLDFDGTVVLTTPGGATAAAGPRESAETTLAMRRVRIGRIPDPVRRLISAAEVTAAPPRSTGGTTTALTLMGLAVLGAAWAVGIGAGRRNRQARERLAEARAAMRVHLDTLRARASALARGGRLTDASRPRVQAALGTYAEAIAALQQAASAEEVAGLAPRVAAGLDAVGAAGRDAGEEWADELDDDPFAGLCAADPAHGPPEGEGPLAPGGEDVPLCARCLELARRGEAAPLRMVPAGGRPVPFTETAGLLRELVEEG